MTRRLLLAAALGTAACRPSDRPARETRAAAGTTPAAAAQTLACGATTISGDGIGALRIGAPADSVRRQCVVVRDTTELRGEGLPTRVMTVSLGATPVEAEVVDGRVWRIAVTEPELRTSDSLGVGTSLGRLLTLRGARALTGEGEAFVVSPAHCGLSFQLSEPELDVPEDNSDTPVLRRLPRSTTVTRVLVTGCRGAA